MYCRMFLLALLPLRRNAYEREATQSVRRYLFRLCAPLVLVCGVLAGVGAFFAHYFDVSFLALANVLLLLLWTLTLFHFWRVEIYSSDGDGEVLHAQFSRYAHKLVELNGLAPIDVYQLRHSHEQAYLIRKPSPRIVVTDSLSARIDALGMIGIFAHELAHRELPLGDVFPRVLQTFVHYVPDLLLKRLNKKVGIASQQFVELQKVMDTREATRRMIELSVLHMLNMVCWHMSSSPALRLREHACDAIAMCITRNPFPVIHGLSSLNHPVMAPYPYVHDAHPQTHVRIKVLLAMEQNITHSP